jgi:LPXTG-motif cell wall-anchored protein
VSPDREAPNPARLYAAVAGALLFLLGIAGFFYSASFGTPGDVAPALAGLRVNAWLNLLYAALGALGLLLAGTASRAYALAAGALLTALGVWGLALDPGASILGFLPATGTNEALALVLGLLGLLAAAGTPRRRPAGPRRRGVAS